MPLPSVSLPYLVRQPLSIEPGRKPPLLVLLHGLGSNEADLMGLADQIDPRYLIVSIRAPIVLGSYGFGWYSITGLLGNLKHNEVEAEAGRLAAEKAIEELTAAFDIDKERVFLMGFSQGAVMSLGITLIKPQLIAGAVIMSGALLPAFADRVRADQSRRIPILVVHGRWDEVLPVDGAREIRDFLATQSVDLSYHEYPMGHEVSIESLDEVTIWLTSVLDAT
ncbi:MAG: dienelactone hydrolase family protein [Capsulimonadaceae bacterium]|nr:dienelactone hydrolase family protein [Capsulimonadaceae bacterium]